MNREVIRSWLAHPVTRDIIDTALWSLAAYLGAKIIAIHVADELERRAEIRCLN